MQHLLMLQDDLPRLFIAFIYDRLYFLIDLSRHVLTVALRMGKIPSDKYLVVVIIIADYADILGHSVSCHHHARFLCRLPDIGGRSGRNIIKDNLLRDTPA